MNDQKKIDDYIERCRRLTPEEKLKKMGEMREFFFKYMTPEGRAFLLETRGIDTFSYERKKSTESQVLRLIDGDKKK